MDLSMAELGRGTLIPPLRIEVSIGLKSTMLAKALALSIRGEMGKLPSRSQRKFHSNHVSMRLLLVPRHTRVREVQKYRYTGIREQPTS